MEAGVSPMSGVHVPIDRAKRYHKTPEERKAWQLYRKHITGRGYCWSVGCTIAEDVQRACLEAIEWARRTARP